MLEDELREPLFIRQGRGAIPTRAGQTLILLGRRLLEDLTTTVGQIRDEHDELHGTLRIAGGMTVCLYVLPPLLKEFRRAHPRVEIQVITGATPRLIRQLRTGLADVALLTLPVDEPSFVIVPALREELMLVMPAGHPLSAKDSVGVEALVGQPFIIFEQGSNTRRTLDEFFVRVDQAARRAQPRPSIVLKASSRAGWDCRSFPTNRSLTKCAAAGWPARA